MEKNVGKGLRHNEFSTRYGFDVKQKPVFQTSNSGVGEPSPATGSGPVLELGYVTDRTVGAHGQALRNR